MTETAIQDTDQGADLEALFNAQTGRASWTELERAFARGVLIRVDASLDLVAVAGCFARDEAALIKGWMAAGQVAPVSAEEAHAWSSNGAQFWAVVAAPFVLAQAISIESVH